MLSCTNYIAFAHIFLQVNDIIFWHTIYFPYPYCQYADTVCEISVHLYMAVYLDIITFLSF